MNMAMQMDDQIVILVDFFQRFATSKNRKFFSMTIQSCTGSSRTHMSQEYLWSGQRIRLKDSINIFLILLFTLIRKSLPNLMFVFDIIVCRKRSPKSNNTKPNFKHKLLFMNIENIWWDMLLPIQISKRIMIARDKDYLTLENIMQEKKYLFTSFVLFFLWMLLRMMVTVDNISPNKTVIKMKRITSNCFC